MLNLKKIPKYGDKGDDFRQLQAQLSKLNFSTKIDGAYGSNMQTAVSKFQKSKGLNGTGTIGEQTLKFLECTVVSTSPCNLYFLDKIEFDKPISVTESDQFYQGMLVFCNDINHVNEAKVELKAQKAEQEAQASVQDVHEDTQRAQENQAKADKAPQGKRRRHEPENVAHTCISPDSGGLYGALDNTCNYKVWYAFCSYRPKEKSFAASTNCEKQSFGADSVGPRKSSAVHTHNLEKIYWSACKDPAWPIDLVFEGDGIRGRCHTVGGE